MLGTDIEVEVLHEWVPLAYEVADELDLFVDTQAAVDC